MHFNLVCPRMCDSTVLSNDVMWHSLFNFLNISLQSLLMKKIIVTLLATKIKTLTVNYQMTTPFPLSKTTAVTIAMMMMIFSTMAVLETLIYLAFPPWLPLVTQIQNQVQNQIITWILMVSFLQDSGIQIVYAVLVCTACFTIGLRHIMSVVSQFTPSLICRQFLSNLWHLDTVFVWLFFLLRREFAIWWDTLQVCTSKVRCAWGEIS